MNLSTIEISPEEAESKLAEYEKLVRDERTAQDEAIAQAYRAAKRGLSVIRLSEAVLRGGWFDPSGLPRIAIAGADWPEVYCRWDGDDVVYADQHWSRNRGALVGSGSVRVRMRDVGTPSVKNYRTGKAVVPMVPPPHRPKPRRLRHCHVLWEVEAWNMQPPRDPALIRHIRGDLWSVLAVWDLTELERAILAGA